MASRQASSSSSPHSSSTHSAYLAALPPKPRPPPVFRQVLPPLAQRGRGYTHLALVFSFSGAPVVMPIESTRRHVSAVYAATLTHWPLLQGTLWPVESEEYTNLLELRYMPGHAPARTFFFSTQWPYNTQQGPRYRGPFIINHILVSKSRHSIANDLTGPHRFAVGEKPQQPPYLPIALKVSFSRLNLVLGFSFHRAIFDQAFIGNFLRRFSINTLTLAKPAGIYKPLSIPQPLIPRSSPSWIDFPQYNWAPSADNSSRCLSQEDLDQRIIIIADATTAEIRSEAIKALTDGGKDGSAFPNARQITMRDALLALIWVAVLRVRLPRLRAVYATSSVTSTSRFAMSTTPGQCVGSDGPEYCGSVDMTACASMSVDDLLSCSEVNETEVDPQLVPSAGFALAAHHIRTASRSVTPDSVAALSTLCANLADPSTAEAALACGVSSHETGLLCHDWRGLDTNLEFYLPATCQQAAYFPRPDTCQEGTIILLPNRAEKLPYPTSVRRSQINLRRRWWVVYLCLRRSELSAVIDILDSQAFLAESTSRQDNRSDR